MIAYGVRVGHLNGLCYQSNKLAKYLLVKRSFLTQRIETWITRRAANKYNLSSWAKLSTGSFLSYQKKTRIRKFHKIKQKSKLQIGAFERYTRENLYFFLPCSQFFCVMKNQNQLIFCTQSFANKNLESHSYSFQ